MTGKIIVLADYRKSSDKPLPPATPAVAISMRLAA